MRTALLPAALLLAFSLSAPAIAAEGVSPDDNRAVKELVKQGTSEYTKQNWEAARVAFAKAWDMKQHYAIAANLGEVELKLKMYRAAAEHLKFAIANVPPEHGEKRKIAEASLVECRAHLSTVRVSVNVLEATVRLDGHEIAYSDQSELLIDPGPHKLTAEKAGYLVAARAFSASAGESREVRLDLTPQPPAADAPDLNAHAQPQAAPPLRKADEDESHSDGRVWILVGGGAATAIAAGLGTYFTVHGSSLADRTSALQDEIARSSPSDDPNQCAAAMPPGACAALVHNLDERQSNSNARNAAWVTAGALGVATVVTYLVWPTGSAQPKNSGRVLVAPMLAGARGGVLQISF